jgi:hypothetical protein
MKTLARFSISVLIVLLGCKKDETSVTGPDQALRAPTGLKAVRAARTAVRLSWTDNTETEDGFAIERSIGAGSFSQVLFAIPNATTAIDSSGLLTDASYSYRVRALRYSERGDYSEVVTIRLSLPYP